MTPAGAHLQRRYRVPAGIADRSCAIWQKTDAVMPHEGIIPYYVARYLALAANEHVEFMIGAGPQLSYATAGGGTQIASEFALEWMIWPTADRKFGWFVEPTYSYSFSRGHEQAIGVTTGLTMAIP